jgi:geranylgeranyl diphosphate synthase type I
VHALSQANGEDKERLLTILKEEGDENVSEAVAILEKYGSIEYAWNVAQEDVNQAKELLINNLDESPAREALLLIADFVLERSH